MATKFSTCNEEQGTSTRLHTPRVIGCCACGCVACLLVSWLFTFLYQTISNSSSLNMTVFAYLILTDFFGSTAAILISFVSNSYCGKLTEQISMSMP